MNRVFVMMALLFSACTATDADFDGVGGEADCNDSSAAIRPGAAEVCDNVDNNCDGWIDEGLNCPEVETSCPLVWFLDGDGDGFAVAGTGICTRVAGYIEVASTATAEWDCDDRSPLVNPAAQEVECDGIDTNCDGEVDNGAVEAPLWYLDDDGDGFGSPLRGEKACSRPARHVEDGADCDDRSPLIHPGAPERCDDVDTDCDGLTADDESVNAVRVYIDVDGDGFGYKAGPEIFRCNPEEEGVAVNDSDCDDLEASVNPDADEVCDLIDNDCDGAVDDADSGVVDQEAWYADEDADGYGNPSAQSLACYQPRNAVAGNTDCNDAVGGAHPGATEVCDGIDNDCDGAVDEAGATGETQWYPDFDQDGYGTISGAVRACARPTVGRYLSSAETPSFGSDCNDRNETVHPGAPELCDTIDHNCDGNAAGVEETWYADQDGDGYGALAAPLSSCGTPQGYVKNRTDCDDAALAVHPGAPELCDTVDNDCDGLVDENAVAVPWYRDQDGDGYGDVASQRSSCAQPSGYVRDATDCNDGALAVNAGAVEICSDTVDNDCDTAVDGADSDCGGTGGGDVTPPPVPGSGSCSLSGNCPLSISCKQSLTHTSKMEVCVKGPLRSAVVPGSESSPGGDTETGSLLTPEGEFMNRYYSLFYERTQSGFVSGIDTSRPVYTTATAQYCATVAKGDWFPTLEGQIGTGGAMIPVEADLDLNKAEIAEGTTLCEISANGTGGGASGFVRYIP